MGIGTPLHERTSALCNSLRWKEWSGYFAVCSYETILDFEYTAFRNRAGLLDISPLYKQRIRGRDSERLLDRMVPRDLSKCRVGQVIYTPWCDDDGAVVDDGTIQRIAEDDFRLTSAYPSFRWVEDLALGLQVSVEEESEQVAGLALQGPMSRAILQAAGLTGIETLKFFWLLQGKLGGVPVEVSRTGYTGDLGYEIWIPADQAVTVWDTLMAAGQPYGITPAGLDALDVTRLEAGLILIDVEYHSSQQTLVDARRRTPFELGLDWAVNPRKTGNYLGRRALAREREQGSARKLVGLETQWEQVEALHDKIDLTPELEPGTGRDPSPLYADGHQIGHASSHCWSPILKKHISLGTVETPYAREGSLVEMEYTLEYERHRVQAKIVPRPFFDPPRKRA